MRIVREQMLCIVSPDWPGAGVLSSAECSALDRLFESVGVIHFASLALLPPHPDAEPGALPSLLLELTVDEGLRPADLIARLAFDEGAALWQLYQVFWAAALPAGFGERSEALRQHLLDHCHVADGAFVGPRDLPVAQVREERTLWNAVRQHAASSPAPRPVTRDGLALELARWVMAQPRFERLTQPGPRSFWRGALATGAAKADWVIGLAVGALLLLGLALGVVAVFHLVLLGLGLGDSLIGLAVDLVQRVAGMLIRAGGRAVVALALAVEVSVMLVVLPGLLVPAWRRWLNRVVRELDRPMQTAAARTAHLFGGFVVAALGVGVVAACIYIVGGVDALVAASARVGQACSTWAGPLLLVLAGVWAASFVVLLAVLADHAAALQGWSDVPLWRAWRRLRRAFHRPQIDEVPRALQVHESIERCEAELVTGTAHMVSLTELRRPYAWHAWWTLVSLRVVTFIGYILYTEGRLGNAPGIQYSHWHVIDGGRRLLFCANFDGTFGGYLDDFIKGASTGTTLFWRWSELRPRQAAATNQPAVTTARRFPPTRLIVFRGVKCEQQFKTYARESMLPHLYRFDATGLSSVQKMQARRLRDALAGERNDTKDDTIMRSLES